MAINNTLGFSRNGASNRTRNRRTGALPTASSPPKSTAGSYLSEANKAAQRAVDGASAVKMTNPTGAGVPANNKNAAKAASPTAIKAWADAATYRPVSVSNSYSRSTNKPVATGAATALPQETRAAATNVFKTRDGIKAYAKSKYGIDLSDSDITFNNGQVYVRGQSVGTPDYIDGSGTSYFNNSDSVLRAVDGILANGYDNAQQDYINTVNNQTLAQRDVYNDEYSKYFESARDALDSGYLDPSVERAIRDSFGYGRASGMNNALASGSERNSGNIDSLSVQNRANYGLAVDSQVAQALLDAMNAQYGIDSGRMQEYRSGLNDYGANALAWDTQSANRQDAYNAYRLNQQAQDREDRESAANIESSRRNDDRLDSETLGYAVGGLADAAKRTNPYLNGDGSLNSAFEGVDFMAQYQNAYDEYLKAVENGDAAAASMWNNEMANLAEARNAKIRTGRYSQYAGETLAGYRPVLTNTDSARSYGLQRQANDNDRAAIDAQVEMNRLDNSTLVDVAGIEGRTNVDVANATASAQRDAANAAADASKYASDNELASTLYGYNTEVALRNNTGGNQGAFPTISSELNLGRDLTYGDIAKWINDTTGVAAGVKVGDEGLELTVKGDEAAKLKRGLDGSNLTENEKYMLAIMLGL